MNKLLSEEELKESISSYVLGTPHESHNYSIFANEVAKRLLPLIQSQKRLYAEMVVDTDTDVDISEALKKIYSDGYSNGYNDRTYENSYNSVDFRMAEAIAPAVAKVRSRYDKQLKALEEK